MKATKATNIQIRLLVEESQQLNSKKWNTRNKHKLKGEEQEETLEFFFLLFITRIAL